MSESKLTKFFREQVEGTEGRLSVLDQFENGFNTPNRCVDCGLSKKAHDKGGIGHPFRTRKQARSNSIEVRGAKDWDNLTRDKQLDVQNIIDGFFEDNREEFDNLSPNDMQAVGKKWSQLKPDVKSTIQDASRFSGVEISRAEALLRDFQKRFGADAPQDAEGALDHLLQNGISRPEAVRAIQSMGGAIEAKEVKDEIEFWNTATSGQKRRIATMLDINANARWEQLTPAEQGSLAVWWDEGGGSKSIGGTEFYNYSGNEKLDSREDDTDDFVQGMMGIRDKMKKKFKGKTKKELEDMGIFGLGEFYGYEQIPSHEGLINIETTGPLFNNVLSQLSALAPIQNFEIKAQFTDGKTGLIILSFDKAKDQKMMVDVLKGVMKTNGVTKVDSKEVFAGEGQKFEVTKDGTMLPKGRYEVIGKKTDQAHSGPWGTFSITTVKNLDTGERQEIPTGNAQLIYGIENKKKASEINESQWNGATKDRRKRWLNKHVEALFTTEVDEWAKVSWRQLSPEIRQELKDEEIVGDFGIRGKEFMDHGLRRQIERQIEDGAIETQEQIKNIIRGSLGRAGVPEEEFDDMFDHFEDNFPQIK